MLTQYLKKDTPISKEGKLNSIEIMENLVRKNSMSIKEKKDLLQKKK